MSDFLGELDKTLDVKLTAGKKYGGVKECASLGFMD